MEFTTPRLANYSMVINAAADWFVTCTSSDQSIFATSARPSCVGYEPAFIHSPASLKVFIKDGSRRVGLPLATKIKTLFESKNSRFFPLPTGAVSFTAYEQRLSGLPISKFFIISKVGTFTEVSLSASMIDLWFLAFFQASAPQTILMLSEPPKPVARIISTIASSKSAIIFVSSASSMVEALAAAASHHRLTWIHPFGDGNGRTTRLFSTALLRAYDLDANGIWSMSRGLARKKSEYYKFLSLADADRQNDRDGRGTLTNKGLCDFCRFYLEVMRDQMEFMLSLLRLEKIIDRYARLLRETFPKNSELYTRIIREIWISGEMPRGKASQITGMSERTSRSILSELEKRKFIKSDTPKSPVKIRITTDISEEIFPNLFIG